MNIITIDEALHGAVRLAVFQTEETSARGESPDLEADLVSVTARIKNAYPRPADAAALLKPARQLYRVLGLDPTKNRPSSEALIRRVITGRGLYRINRVVDTCNLCSMDIALPIGLYDTAAVHWPAILRRGIEGEGYRGLGKDHVNVAGRYVLVDEEGPFGNPSSDSYRTRIREETSACTFVIFAQASYDATLLTRHLRVCEERMVRYCGGSLVASHVVG